MKKCLIPIMALGALLIFCTSAQGVESGISSSPIEANKNFKAKDYAGTWYELARLSVHFERNCLPPITFTFELNSLNEFKVTNQCKLDNGEITSGNGQAIFTNAQDIAKLKLSFAPSWLSWTGLSTWDYWILYTDYTRYALVGSPNREYLWLLSRSEQNSKGDIERLINLARQYGYPVHKLMFNAQSFNVY